MLIETTQLKEKLEDELKELEWSFDTYGDIRRELIHIKFEAIVEIEQLFIKYFMSEEK